MSEKLIFLRRTQKEIEIFGGDIYIDINGRNVGILGTTDFNFDISPGKHKIKMYKSHTYGSFIGHAEAEITIYGNEQLLIKYSAPMLINQPGNIMVSSFESYSQVESSALEKEQKIVLDDTIAKEKKLDQEEKSRNRVIIFIVIMVISAILYAISVSDIYNY